MPEPTNRLIHSTSPYLLQHAHNPIDWYPWGDEAIAKAKAEDKPLFVSIGYSTCYWCHVMEREIFCNPEMGALMNRCFVNVKIDREERPDIDELYMAARQLLTRQGGWPNNVVITPDLKPFWAGGTQFIDNRHGMSFPELVLWLEDNWQNNRQKIETAATEITRYMELQLTEKHAPYPGDDFRCELPEELMNTLSQREDKEYGGFYTEPKFPHENYLLFLIDHTRTTKSPEALAMVRKALDGMAAGGLHDHVGGGFHRYAVDSAWAVPHFEKMLYNQALLAKCYVEAYAITEHPYYRIVAESTYAMVAEHFTGNDGQFFSALDAETDEVEGAYYAWSSDDIHAALTSQQSALFFSCFQLADIPVFAGHKHPHGGVITALHSQIQEFPWEVLGQLKKIRDKRLLPMRDTKIITAWHAMMTDSYATAGRILQNKDYITIAEKAASYITDHLLTADKRLLRIAGHHSVPGFLEDYAHTMQAMLSLNDATQDKTYLAHATSIAETCCQLFEDAEHGGFFYTEAREDQLLRIKTATDGALPSANGIMLQNLLRLGWEEKAKHCIAAFHEEMVRTPLGYVSMIQGMEQHTSKTGCSVRK